MVGARTAALVAVVVGAGTLVAAHTATSRDSGTKPARAEWAKLSSSLAAVLRAELSTGRGLETARTRGLRVQEGRVLVVVEGSGTRAAAAAAVRSTRGRIVAMHATLVQAFVAPGALRPLSRSTAVAYVRAPNAPVTTKPAQTDG